MTMSVARRVQSSGLATNTTHGRPIENRPQDAILPYSAGDRFGFGLSLGKVVLSQHQRWSSIPATSRLIWRAIALELQDAFGVTESGRSRR